MLSTGWTVLPKIWKFWSRPMFYGRMPFLTPTLLTLETMWYFEPFEYNAQLAYRPRPIALARVKCLYLTQSTIIISICQSKQMILQRRVKECRIVGVMFTFFIRQRTVTGWWSDTEQVEGPKVCFCLHDDVNIMMCGWTEIIWIAW